MTRTTLATTALCTLLLAAACDQAPTREQAVEDKAEAHQNPNAADIYEEATPPALVEGDEGDSEEGQNDDDGGKTAPGPQ